MMLMMIMMANIFVSIPGNPSNCSPSALCLLERFLANLIRGTVSLDSSSRVDVLADRELVDTSIFVKSCRCLVDTACDC